MSNHAWEAGGQQRLVLCLSKESLMIECSGSLDHYTGLKNPSFAKIAEAVGLKGFEVNVRADLE